MSNKIIIAILLSSLFICVGFLVRNIMTHDECTVNDCD